MTENNESIKAKNSRLYPRRTEKGDFTLWEKIVSHGVDSDLCRIICERNVVEAFKKNPLLKILKGALKNAGCPLDLKRHISCEDCNIEVQGGFDGEFNQVVVCKNITKIRENPETVLLHELIHMYDHCVNEINFENLEHLACTEIRASNLAHCSFLSSVFMGQSSVTNFKKTHQYCVKMNAAMSLSKARNLDFHTAVKYVLRVFDKCYNDLEPIGRRIRRNSAESFMAEEEAKCFLITN